MNLRGLPRVMRRHGRVASGVVRLLGRFGVAAARVMLRRFVVMLGRGAVVLCRLRVVFHRRVLLPPDRGTTLPRRLPDLARGRPLLCTR